ncbi:MAG TPA: cytochrome c oxidase assembly protein [Thermoanaerobaculia bacterium]|nr:cytochrome c oxidase assembly protein [Thermoanaerobaculia bacterium]
MAPVAAAALASWSARPGLALLLLAAFAVYLRGWSRLHRARPARFPARRLCAFASGLAVVAVAVASPLDAFGALLLSAHMLQHLLLLTVAPALLLLGSPDAALEMGLPRALVREAIAPLRAAPPVRAIGRVLGRPDVGLAAMTLAMWGWHVPAAYGLALSSPAWHEVEHASFLVAGTLFWFPVLRPWPGRPRLQGAMRPLYLLAGDLANTALAAVLTFSDRVLYPAYADAPRLFGLSALADQSLAGVLMWVPGSLVFLVPAAVMTARWLAPERLARTPEAPPPPRRAREPFDLLRAPGVGPVLRSAWGRRAMQGTLFVIALLVIADGLIGAPAAAANLAGVVPWIWARGLLVVALLVAGNVFCMACPFMLPREAGKRLGLATRAWPKALRSKWTAAALLALFFLAYEAFDLWDRPAATAGLLVGYFAAAFAVDALFRGATFCKYLCPIGQFQFVGSLVSPLEVRVRKPDACASCSTHDCLRGNTAHRGCELGLFLPRKAGNLDCTFCLDCVKACPHEAIGILPVLPGRELVRDLPRSAVGRFADRPDLAALALVFTGGAFAAAFAMVAPSGARAFALLVTAALAAAFAFSPRESRSRIALTLVPLGIGMWAAHWLHHLLVAWPPGVFSGASLLGLELTLLDAGLLGSLYAAWRSEGTRRAKVPWAAVAAALWICGAWIVLQPMPMRGMVHS